MVERKTRAKRATTAPAKTRATRARKATSDGDAPEATEPGAQSFRPEPLPQRTRTHTRSYDPE